MIVILSVRRSVVLILIVVLILSVVLSLIVVLKVTVHQGMMKLTTTEITRNTRLASICHMTFLKALVTSAIRLNHSKSIGLVLAKKQLTIGQGVKFIPITTETGPITSSLLVGCGVGVGLIVLLRLSVVVILLRPRVVVILLRPRVAVVLLRPGIVGIRVVVISIVAAVPVVAASSSSSSSLIVVAILRERVISSNGAIIFSAILR